MVEGENHDGAYHLAGDRLGRYQIIQELGRGSMGVVYEAFQEDLKRKVALKVLPANIALDSKQVKRFQREAESMARLQHENIIPIFDVAEVDRTHYFAMRMVDGRPFGEQLGRDRDSIREAAAMAMQAARGLAHAHAHGVIHRDIKPGNLLVERDGRVLVTDFGLARLTDSASLTSTDAIVGTPKYMSPEQILPGTRPLDGRTDVYSLGATLYEVCCGRPPFDEPSVQAFIKAILETRPVPPRKRNRQVPHDLSTIIMRCLEKEPKDRYESAEALANDLERFLAGERIHARPKGMLALAYENVRRHKLVSALATVAVVALVLTLMLGGAVEKARRSSWVNFQLGAIQRIADLDEAAREIDELAVRYPDNSAVSETRRSIYHRRAEQLLENDELDPTRVLATLQAAGDRTSFWRLMMLVEARRFEQARAAAARLAAADPVRVLTDARLAVEGGQYRDAIDALDTEPGTDREIPFRVYHYLTLGEAYLGTALDKELEDFERRSKLNSAQSHLQTALKIAESGKEQWLRARIRLLLIDVLDRLGQSVDPRFLLLDGATAIRETLRALTRWWGSMSPAEASVAQEYLDRILTLAEVRGLSAPDLEKRAEERLAAASPGRPRVIANLLLAVAYLSRGRTDQALRALADADDALLDADDPALSPYISWGSSLVHRAENEIGAAIEWSMAALDQAVDAGGGFPDAEILARYTALLVEEAARRNQTDLARRAREDLVRILLRLTGPKSWVNDLTERVRNLAARSAPPR